jgi:hypothetical protein
MGYAQTVICAINTLGFIAISVLLVLAVRYGQTWAQDIAKDNIGLLIGCWITNFTTIVNFTVGSSLSGQRKTESMTSLIDRIKPIKPADPPPSA